jgi:hypothetical protein
MGFQEPLHARNGSEYGPRQYPETWGQDGRGSETENEVCADCVAYTAIHEIRVDPWPDIE